MIATSGFSGLLCDHIYFIVLKIKLWYIMCVISAGACLKICLVLARSIYWLQIRTLLAHRH